MASVHDVAAYILWRQGQMSAMKLQKLVYYAQAWHLVWDEVELFQEPIEAWTSGPVCPGLYQSHKGLFQVGPEWKAGDPSRLSESEAGTVDLVLEYYGDRTAQWLSDLTHAEEPWQNARRGLGPRDRGTRTITTSAMAEYYASLRPDE